MGRARADEFRPIPGGTSGFKPSPAGGGTKLDTFVLRTDYDLCESMTSRIVRRGQLSPARRGPRHDFWKFLSDRVCGVRSGDREQDGVALPAATAEGGGTQSA